MKYIAFVLLLCSSCNFKPTCGTVVEKYVFPDRYGLPHYSILVKKEDGTYFSRTVYARDYGKLIIGKNYCW